jgi:hypothetical protein
MLVPLLFGGHTPEPQANPNSSPEAARAQALAASLFVSDRGHSLSIAYIQRVVLTSSDSH